MLSSPRNSPTSQSHSSYLNKFQTLHIPAIGVVVNIPCSNNINMGKQSTAATKPLTEIVHRYNSDPTRKKFKPENFLEIPRLFGATAAIDMNRLVCQHQQHVASAYMRRIRKDKIQQRDVYFKKLQSIPMRIKRIAVGPNYIDPYTSMKQRLPKLGQDQNNKIGKSHTPPYPYMENSTFVPHNGLSSNLNVLFKMNPVGVDIKTNSNTNGNLTSPTTGNTTNSNNNNSTSNNNKPNYNRKSQEEPQQQLPFPLSPRRTKLLKQKSDALPKIKKRLAIDVTETSMQDHLNFSSADTTPRCPTNSPRHAKKTVWNFNVPKELKKDERRTHISSIPRGKEALSAITSVQKYNKPLPMIMAKA